jgi:hypothetical protein
MTKEELYFELTGTEKPTHITGREEVIIEKCLDIINRKSDTNLTDEQYIKIFDKFRKEFTNTADDNRLKEWGNTDTKIRDIKIKGAKFMIESRSDGIKLKTFIDSII